MPLILLAGVLRIENQNITAVEKLDQSLMPICRSFLCLFRPHLISTSRMQKEFIWLMIRQKSDGASAGEEAIARTDARMIYKNRVHLHLAEGKRHFTQPTDVDFPGELAHRYREERRLHWLGKNFAEGGTGAVEP